jgi:hypothetical protein
MNVFRRHEPKRYRVVDLPLWEDIQGLHGDAVMLLNYLWYGPQSTQYGILRVPDGYAMTDLGWDAARLAAAWASLAAADLVWRDGTLTVIVPFLRSNVPANTNIVKGWKKAVSLLPDSPLFGRLYTRASEWLHPEGLDWLAGKIPSPPEPLSEQSRNSVSSIQESESRKQKAESRMQEAGVREEPDAALRFASPLEAAPLRAAESGNGDHRLECLERNIRLGFVRQHAKGYTDEEVEAARARVKAGNGQEATR